MLEENDRIRAMEERKRENPAMMKNRRSLPAWQERDRIVRAVRDNQVTVLVGVFVFKAAGLGLPFVLLYVPTPLSPPKKKNKNKNRKRYCTFLFFPSFPNF